MAPMPRTANAREFARLRKQRQRDRQREMRRLAAEAEASRQETIAEHLAPSVLRHPILDRDGGMLVGPRVYIVDGMPVRALALGVEGDPVRKLARERSITQRHKEAARQLQCDWADVGSGINASAVDYLRSGGGGGDGMGGHAAILGQVQARARLEGAMAHLGAFAPSVVRVVLDCVPVYVWAESVGKARDDGVAWIAAALTRLALFYWPAGEVAVEQRRAFVFAPARSAYSTEAVAA
jgi:hypothetical protein